MATGEESKDDEIKIQETRGSETPPTQNFFCVMNSYAREFIFVLAVAFTAIAALQNGPLKSRKANPPVSFFSEPSLVTDFYEGDFSRLMSLILEKDVSLVMFYAPWDAKSMEVKKEFEKVAKFYHHEVFFAAINCWWPDGECSRRYKISAYPMIVVFVHDVGGIRYEGPLQANYVIAFLDNVLSPLVTIQHAGELLDLKAKHEAVLVGVFNLKIDSHTPGYRIFYISSLRALTRDPNRKLGFAVITNSKTAHRMGIQTFLQLHLWNQTEHFLGKSFSSSQILDWVYSKISQTSQWITPPGSKSTLLSEFLENMATIIMFTPRNLLMHSSPYYDLFREVSLDYYNCNKSAEITSLVHRVVLRRHISQEAVTKLLHKCHLASADESHELVFRKASHCDLTCCQEVSLNLRLSKHEQCFCRVCIHHLITSLDKMKLTECENTLNLILKSLEISSFPLSHHDSCQHIEASYPIKFGSYNQLSLKCDNELKKIQFKAPITHNLFEFSEVKDDHIIAMTKNVDKNECNRLKFGLNYSNLNFPEFPAPGGAVWHRNFTGLGCHTNRTLTFIALDSMLFHTFAESLGIDILNERHQSAAVIIDTKQESSYLLKGGINKKSLVEFVKNYTSGTLDRFLRSTVRKLDECTYHRESNFCLKELTTDSFMDYVLDNESDVILLYYAPWCAACSAMFHIFLSVANYFSNIEKVKFARISGDDHDLPWEYTVEKYPSIIFFPAQKKADSVEFPSNVPITMTNLLHFVLINSQPKVRWVIAMRMCNRECVANNIAQSSLEVRRLFREYHIAVNQLYFHRELAENKPKTKFKRFIKVHSRDRKEPFSIMKYLIHRIRRKRTKIAQAFQLLSLLQKKRDMYLKEMKREKVSKKAAANTDNQNAFRDEL